MWLISSLNLKLNDQKPKNLFSMCGTCKLGLQSIVSEFDSHWVLHTSGLELTYLKFSKWQQVGIYPLSMMLECDTR